jgi:hypothetical protein
MSIRIIIECGNKDYQKLLDLVSLMFENFDNQHSMQLLVEKTKRKIKQ